MTYRYLIFIAILFCAMFLTVHKKKLTTGGAVAGGIIGCCIFLGAGFAGIALIGLFFVLGTLATAWKINTKQALGAAEADRGQRKPGQVIANGGLAAICGVMAFFAPAQEALWRLTMAAALSSATADTLSSELGILYGKRFYNILHFKPDKRGENGVVSLEGTMIGVIGSTIIATAYSMAAGWSSHFSWIIIAGTVGNVADSILGASLERKRVLGNDAVNFINTLVAATTAGLLTAFSAN